MLPPSLEAVFDQFINKLASCEWAAGVRCKMICRFGQRFLTVMCSFSYSRVVLPVSVEEVRTYSFTLIPSVMDTVTIGIFHLLAPVYPCHWFTQLLHYFFLFEMAILSNIWQLCETVLCPSLIHYCLFSLVMVVIAVTVPSLHFFPDKVLLQISSLLIGKFYLSMHGLY